MARTVLYGGTFNPIHMGHLALCRYLLDSGGYDRILLMPTASPPHKPASQLASGQARLELCHMATAELAGVRVDDWEIVQGGKSYTVDTLAYLRRRYPDDSLFLLIGSDMLLTFCEWKDWREIANQATLLVASRSKNDEETLRAQCAELTEQGVAVQLLDNPVIELSSTTIRRQIAEAGQSTGVLPQVLEYCKANNLYSENYDLKQLHRIIWAVQKPERYRHSLCVERRAVRLAEKHGADVNQAAAAGILHDICKNMPKEPLLQMLSNNAILTDIDFNTQTHLLHSYAGAVYLQRELGFTDSDLLNAVRYHTTGRRGMSLLEKIIYLADLTSEERTFQGVGKLRRMSDRSLDEGMLFSLRFMVEEHLPQKGYAICNDTKEALEEYRSKLKQEDYR